MSIEASTIEQLNQQFAIDSQLQFVEGEGGLVMMDIDNQAASARIALYGGQILSFKAQQQQLFFLSEKALYAEGESIKGGAPICWPWFATDPENKGRPFHGFARILYWQVCETQQLDSYTTRVVLSLKDNEQTRKLWPYAFELRVEYIISRQLQINLITHNTGDQPFTITQALHSYFAVQDIHRVLIEGLDGRAYYDKARSNTGDEFKRQCGEVDFAGEVDRIYQQVPQRLWLNDVGAGGKVQIDTTGHSTAVVWNPWLDISREMKDLRDDDYLRFVCIETANVLDDALTIAPGQQHKLTARYTLA